MQPNEITEVLNRPIGQELPARDVTRLACVAKDGSPRNVPIASRSPLTSNETFSEWGQVFGDEVLATAILDRLLHHCDVISINGPSYRLKNRLAAIERDRDDAA